MEFVRAEIFGEAWLVFFTSTLHVMNLLIFSWPILTIIDSDVKLKKVQFFCEMVTNPLPLHVPFFSMFKFDLL